jgi:PAS domain S-box-containing protein
MLGSSKSTMEGRPISEVIGHPAFDRIQSHMRRALEGHTVRYVEEVQYARVGWRWIDATYVPTQSTKGPAQGWVATVTDTTRVRQLENSLSLLRSDTEAALATLQHELRNPLAAIHYGLVALQSAGHGSARAQDLLDLIQRQTQFMNRLVNDVVDESQLSALPHSPQPVSVQKIIRSALDSTRHLFDTLGHELRVILPEAEIPVRADVDRLAQALVNLLRNSAQYTPERGIVEVKCEVSGSTVGISVRDNGIGIPAQELPDVFDLYARGRGSKMLRPQGRGIGLQLVKRIVELHGGIVEASSDGPGRGAEFIVRLPLGG